MNSKLGFDFLFVDFMSNLQKLTIDCDSYFDNVLNLLHKYFDLNRMTYFLVENMDLENPTFKDMGDDLYDDYYGYFRDLDPIRKKFTSNIQTIPKEIITLDLVSNTNKVETNQHYKQFLKKYHIFYQLSLPLLHDNLPIGLISFFKSEKEGQFTKEDYYLFRLLQKPLSSSLLSYLKINLTTFETKLFKSIYDKSSVGMAILNSDWNILYLNDRAKNYLSLISQYLGNSLSHHGNIQAIVRVILSDENGLINEVIKNLPFEFFVNDVSFLDNGQTKQYHILNIEFQQDKIEAAINPYNNFLFSKREAEIASLVAQGLSNEEIATELFISVHTVKTHIKNIYKKNGLKNRVELSKALNDSNIKGYKTLI